MSTMIDYADEVWEVTAGCTKASPGCANCWAEATSRRMAGKALPGYRDVIRNGHWNGSISLLKHNLERPLKWKRPRVVFVNSKSDLFHESVPFEYIDRVFYTMIQARQHTFLLLTKRPDRMAAYYESRMDGEDWFEVDLGAGWRAGFEVRKGNIWPGATAENQEMLEQRAPQLVRCPGPVRWLSLEPLLEAVDLAPWIGQGYDQVNWVVPGGESGTRARIMPVSAPRRVRDVCIEKGVPFWFKQWGAWRPINPVTEPHTYELAEQHKIDSVMWLGYRYQKLGKKNTGHELDGTVWQEFPERCEHAGCTSLHASGYLIRSGTEDPGLVEFLCVDHARAGGYCLGCHEYSPNGECWETGFCRECTEEMDADGEEWEEEGGEWEMG